MMPIELDISANAILMLVDRGRKAAGIIARSPKSDAGTASAVRRLGGSSHHRGFSSPFLSGELQRSYTDRVFKHHCTG
jgi:hypothetical protein